MPQMRHPRSVLSPSRGNALLPAELNKCTVTISGKCIVARRIEASALSAKAEKTVQKSEKGQAHCRRKPEVQYRSQRRGKRTATGRRKDSAEVRNQASALSAEAEKTVQKPENEQAHCRQKPKRQCESTN
jgi:hypothetical protein